MKDLGYSNIRNFSTTIGKREFKWGERTYIMGILNATPDSFSDGGEFNLLDSALDHAKDMIEQGADIIDIGGESTRPGAEIVEVEEEIERVVPVIRELAKVSDTPISLDTYKSKVAYKGLEAGANLINDIWGFQKDPDLAKVVAEFGVPCVLMHNDMNHWDKSLKPNYSRPIIDELKLFFNRSIEIAIKVGIKESDIILDPGIGFGKTQEHNRDILAKLGEFKDFGFPLLLGTSRKSVIGTILDLPPKDRLEGTLATSALGIAAGVDILRVHDVLENKRVALVTDKILRR